MTAQTLRTHYTTILDTITKVGFQITSTTSSRSPDCVIWSGFGPTRLVQIKLQHFTSKIWWRCDSRVHPILLQAKADDLTKADDPSVLGSSDLNPDRLFWPKDRLLSSFPGSSALTPKDLSGLSDQSDFLKTIKKNFDKITNPKGSDSNHTLMYWIIIIYILI